MNEVTFAMVHNGMSSKIDLFAGYNNDRPLEEALVGGYRGLMLDSCICDGSLGEKIGAIIKGEDAGDNYLGFCHSSCDAGVRDPAKVFANIKTFLEINRNEVLIIEFEINDESLAELHRSIDESGLDDYIFRTADPSDTNVEWPTMQSLIDANTRLLLFAHGDGMKSCTQIRCPEGIFYTFDHFQETDWNDVATCQLRGDAEPWDRRGFFLMNHWKNNESTDLPSKTNSEEINTYDYLMGRFGECEERIPNVVAVDFWGTGDLLDFVDEVNLRNTRGSATTTEARTQYNEGN